MEKLDQVPGKRSRDETGICGAGPREQFAFLVSQLAGHGVSRFDLMAPDRVMTCSGTESENKNWRWTQRTDDGRRHNTPFGQQGLLDVDGAQVTREFELSLPAILADRVGARGKPTLGRDFYWRSARGGAWAMIVLDDVDVARLPDCRRFILQTSEHKFQALLICDDALDDGGRHSLQSHFVSQKICDPGASSGIQPIRPPGSINRKPGRDSFVTRLIDARLDAPLLHVRALRAEIDRVVVARAATVSAAAISAPPGVLGRRISRGDYGARTDDSPSGDDMSRAMSMLARGASAGDVERFLVESASARGKANPAYFARTTLNSAKFALANGGQLPPRSSRST